MRRWFILTMLILLAGAIAAAILVWRAKTAEDDAGPAGEPGAQGGGFPIPPGWATTTLPGGGPTDSQSQSTTTTQSAAPFTVSRMSDAGRSVFDFLVNEATNDVAYITVDGAVFNAADGEDVELSSQEFTALAHFEASPDRRRALLATGGPTDPEWLMFDILDRSWRPLPPGIRAATWGFGPDRIVAQIADANGAMELDEIDVSKSSFPRTTLAPRFNLLGVALRAVPPDTIYATEKPSAKSDGRIWSFNTKTGLLSLAIAPTSGLMAAIPRSGNVGFLSSSPREFHIMTFSSGMRDVVGVPFATFPQKCAASASTTYCFAPARFTGLLKSLSLPDDWLSGAAISTDALYRTDLGGGETDMIFASGESGVPAMDAIRVETARGGVYALNRRDHALYKITFAPLPL